MIHQIIPFLEHFSYVGIFILSLFSGYIIPVPEEVLLLAVGYIASIGQVSLIPVIIMIMVAFIISDYIVYRLSYHGSKYINKFVEEVLTIKIISKNRVWFEKNIGATILIFRSIPLMRFVGPVFSGYLKVKKKTFLIYNTIGTLLCGPVLVFIGYFAREYSSNILEYMANYRKTFMVISWVVAGFVVTRIIDYVRKIRKCDVDNKGIKK